MCKLVLKCIHKWQSPKKSQGTLKDNYVQEAIPIQYTIVKINTHEVTENKTKWYQAQG